MKLTNLNIGTTRLEGLDKMFPAQEILIQSGQLHQYAAGLFGYNKIPLGVKQRIEAIIRDVFERHGIIEVSLPIIHPKELWDTSGRWDTYIEEGVMLHTESKKGIFALAPTAEEAISEFARHKLSSYKQFPVIYYQMNDKFRNEIRSRGYLMRGVQFTMMDAYSFDTSSENASKSYDRMHEAYIEIFKEIGLDVTPVVADSGSMGGSKSEEFMILSPLGEDTILYNKENHMALNTEILEKDNYEKYLSENYGINDLTNFEEKRSVELGHIFNLGTFYSDKMDIQFTDKDEKNKPVYMGCYGIGVSRLIAVIYEDSLLKDGEKIRGITLPLSVAPYFTQIIYSNNKKDEANDLYNELIDKNIPVILDNREDKKLGIGARINDVKTLGTPFITILGDKIEKNHVEFEHVKTGEKYILPKDIYLETIQEISMSRSFDNNRIKEYLV